MSPGAHSTPYTHMPLGCDACRLQGLLHCGRVPCHIVCVPVSLLMVLGLCSDASSHTPGHQRQCCVPPDSPEASHPQRSSCSLQSRKQNIAKHRCPLAATAERSHSQKFKGEKNGDWQQTTRNSLGQVVFIFISYFVFTFVRWQFKVVMPYRLRQEFYIFACLFVCVSKFRALLFYPRCGITIK